MYELAGFRSGGMVEMGGRFVGLHDPPGDTAGFWDGIERGRLMLRICGNCNQPMHPRRLLCWSCLNTDLSWAMASGQGTLYSFSTVFRAPHEDWAARIPYNLGLIQLAEGVYLFGEILCTQEQLRVGLPLELVIVGDVGRRIPKFRPAQAK